MSDAAKHFDLDFEKRPRYLYTSLACRHLTGPIALEILADIMVKAADNRCKRIMVQCDLSGIEDDSDLMAAMLELASMRSGSRIAFVNCKDAKRVHPAIDEHFQLFDDADAAEKWVLSDSDR